MSEIKPDQSPAPQQTETSDDPMTRLKKPLTVTAPTWVFLVAGLIAVVLLISALD